MRTVAGIFVGGMSRRMGGRPKGLLLAPSGETIVERWRRMFGELGLDVVLVGRRDAYAHLAIEGLDDDPAGIGPIGGLAALLRHAGGGTAIAVGCDMPFVSGELLGKLVSHPSEACAIAPARGAWEPLFARYTGSRPLEVATRYIEGGGRALHGVLERLDAEPLVLTDDEYEELRDWDVLPT
jgi:molybdopterin-guanine dinucleotide biosynthesis protein A